jgi:hypothetical protein
MLTDLVGYAADKKRFRKLGDYIDFCRRYLAFVETGLQAKIVSQNESHYQFFQYRDDGQYNITRPINSRLFYTTENFDAAASAFSGTLVALKDGDTGNGAQREQFIRVIYTLQQAIGAALDALPAGKSNQARKVNGDLFEQLMRLLLLELDIDCRSGVVQVPVRDEAGELLFNTSYQHDLLISAEGELRVIGSVKTSSKDRLDKVFVDKFLYNRLTGTSLPHIAIFLNDVQRKNTRKENAYGINATFLPGHFRAYTVKLNPLDGVYYCDIRPNMQTDALLAKHIRTIDHLFFDDLWGLLNSDISTGDA